MTMTDEEVLMSLYARREELKREAYRNYQLGIGLPYTKEIEEIDRQIAKMEQTTKIVPQIRSAIPMRESAGETKPDDQKMFNANTRQKNKLSFDLESGEMEFGGEMGIAKSGDKDYALVKLLYRNPNTPFTIKSIQENCNPLVNKDAHKFKGEKDIDDTVRQIRLKLKVNKGASFPIVKKAIYGNKSWILTNK